MPFFQPTHSLLPAGDGLRLAEVPDHRQETVGALISLTPRPLTEPVLDEDFHVAVDAGDRHLELLGQRGSGNGLPLREQEDDAQDSHRAGTHNTDLGGGNHQVPEIISELPIFRFRNHLYPPFCPMLQKDGP